MSTAKILVVEDENIVATDIKNRLKRLGYSVLAVVNSGEKALKKVEETHPSLVIMDIRLSGDMDGVTAAEKIRSRFQIPVIYLTAYSDETTLQRAKVTEPFGYILKPFQARDLQIAIEMALYKHQMERRLKSREQRLETIIKSIGDAVIVTDVNGCVQFMNPVAEALTGWNQEEAEGKDLIEIVCLKGKTGEATENIAATVMRKGIVLSLLNSCKLISKDGTERPIGDSAAPIRDREGNITGVVLTFKDFTERKQAEERLIRSAFHDELTQLPNRALFLDRVEQAAQRARRHENYRVAVLLLELDDFRTINDRFGHSIGDELLVAIACRLKACLRAVDTVARLGGDKFAVLLEEISEVGDATRVAERIQAALAFPLILSGHEVLTTVSIGIALSRTGYDQPENIIRDANTAMHGAKVQRKARYAIFDGAIRKSSTASLQRLLNPPLSLNSDCLQLFYQPIVSLSTGKITGFEALVRWQHQDYSLIPSDEFIPKAEANGKIGSLTELFLRKACRQISDWQRQFPNNPPLTISVNISSTELTTPDLIKQILQILQETQLDASSLHLEITENVLMQVAAASQMLQQLRNLGLQLSVDNFGSSYSLLSYLHRFPINTLKIDPAFVSQIGIEPENWEIVQTILMLAHNLSLNVTAEGIETAQQLSQLRRLNCNYGQGYFFSGPLDTETTAALLASAPQW